LITFIIADGILIGRYILSTNTKSKTAILKPTLNTPTNNPASNTVVAITKYPVNSGIAEKIKKSGLTSLYQFIKDDETGRSVVYQDDIGFEGYRVVEIKNIPSTNDYCLTIENIDSDVVPQSKYFTFKAIFIGKNSKYPSSEIFINAFNKQEKSNLDNNTNLTDLIKINDIVRLDFLGEEGGINKNITYTYEGQRKSIVKSLYIQRSL
jgi:hypothetical protein